MKKDIFHLGSREYRSEGSISSSCYFSYKQEKKSWINKKDKMENAWHWNFDLFDRPYQALVWASREEN